MTMQEDDIRDSIKGSMKCPSVDFTDQVMDQISALPQEVPAPSIWRNKWLIIGTCLVAVLSVFVQLPAITYADFTLVIPPIVTPLLGLGVIYLVWNQLEDTVVLSTSKNKIRRASIAL